MKAKEYFDKYYPLIKNDVSKKNAEERVHEMLIEMIGETITITQSRNGRSDRAVLAAVKEQNQKWNSIASMFKRSDIGPIVIRNGFSQLVHEVLLSN